MWQFTKYGFFSVVAARKDRGRSLAIDPGMVQIRARVLGHLRALRERFPELRDAELIETPRADYLYRIVVPKDVWAGVAGALADEIDYDNFKDACARQHDPEDEKARSEFLAALHEVWHVGNDMQARVHGKGLYAMWGLAAGDEGGEDWPDDLWPADGLPGGPATP